MCNVFFLKELVVVSWRVQVTVLDYGTWVVPWTSSTETAPKEKTLKFGMTR
jgi:hypothetical protein